jgi:hypothetical protein
VKIVGLVCLVYTLLTPSAPLTCSFYSRAWWSDLSNPVLVGRDGSQPLQLAQVTPLAGIRQGPRPKDLSDSTAACLNWALPVELTRPQVNAKTVRCSLSLYEPRPSGCCKLPPPHLRFVPHAAAGAREGGAAVGHGPARP